MQNFNETAERNLEIHQNSLKKMENPAVTQTGTNSIGPSNRTCTDAVNSVSVWRETRDVSDDVTDSDDGCDVLEEILNLNTDSTTQKIHTPPAERSLDSSSRENDFTKLSSDVSAEAANSENAAIQTKSASAQKPR